jgi:hypothetical protein
VLEKRAEIGRQMDLEGWGHITDDKEERTGGGCMGRRGGRRHLQRPRPEGRMRVTSAAKERGHEGRSWH